MQLCTPSLVYLVLSGLFLLTTVMRIGHNVKLQSILIKAVFVALWTWLLNLLCVKGYTTISWILVFLPILITFGMMAMIVEMAHLKV